MAYKTLLTVLTDNGVAGTTLAHAATLAEANEAHLDVLCLGVDRSQAGYYYAGANAMILQETIARATEEAETLAAFAREHLDARDGRWGVEAGVAQLADITRHVAARARFSDLVVVPQPYGKDRGAELEPVVEGALFEGQTPVLVVPDDADLVAQPKRIVLAWNESAEALNAVRASLPLLQAADIVHVVIIDPPTHGPNRSDPGGMLSQYLARHGVKSQIDVLSKVMPRVSDILVRHVGDVEADLIVMGAYGHSRFREAILGGATRNMLEHSPVPVFMAH
ncbi:universal stress protein [Primorskyibacter sedentarius]|uniref:Universal stress protein family protein n=1 Tax=Primorskyibacter sedentarius TaxID=745311 RepID=A0A4R3JPG2_9RHOB|nr:universal stress protein [Primorskyibacter sedentarius]TCS67554.1 universal stress protein family protein [Primorskyibacter sedentarius]